MDIRRHLIGGLLAGAVLAPAMAQADAPKWYDKLTLGGYAAGDYVLWLNQPGAFSNNATIPNRVFDANPNVFSYNGELTLAYADTASGTSANVDVLYGTLNNVIFGWGPTLAIGQAYLSQSFGPLTLDLGKFATPVGYETWNLTANANYSRSLTYSLEPFFQTGAKVDYAGPGGFGANLWVDDGNSIDPTNNSQRSDGKGWGLALSYTGIKSLALNAQLYRDQEAFHSGSGPAGYFDTNDMIDVNAAYTLSDSFSFAAEYLYDTIVDGSTTTPYSPKINALALYATYNTPVKNLSVSGRAEQVMNPDRGATTNAGHAPGLLTGTDYTMDSYTLTVKYAMGPVTDIVEYRADAANGYDFNTNGNNGLNPSQVDQTLTFAATYGF